MSMEHIQGRLEPHDRAGLIRLLGDIESTPGSWCNMSFEELEDDNAQRESPLFGFLAARGPANALATVMRESADSLLSVGIQHQAGVKAARQLREAGLPAPDGSRVRQDHPRRGLVIEWPSEQDVADLADWLLASMRVLNRARVSEAIHWTWSIPQ